MDPLLKRKLNAIVKELDKQKNQAFEQELAAVINKYSADVKKPAKSVINKFAQTVKRYNDFVDTEVEKRQSILPSLTKEARYNQLRENNIVPRKETRSVDTIIKGKNGKDATIKLQQLTNLMKKSMKKGNQKDKLIRSKEALIRGIGMNTAEGNGRIIKKRIMSMTQNEWEDFYLTNNDLIGGIWSQYHTETSSNFMATLDYVNAKHETERVLTNTLNEYHQKKLAARRLERARNPKPSRTHRKAQKVAKSVATMLRF